MNRKQEIELRIKEISDLINSDAEIDINALETEVE